VHVESEKVAGEGLGSGLVFWVVVCVEVRVVEALLDCVSLLGVDWGILVLSQNLEWAHMDWKPEGAKGFEERKVELTCKSLGQEIDGERIGIRVETLKRNLFAEWHLAHILF
jgi:hypothetical protein